MDEEIIATSSSEDKPRRELSEEVMDLIEKRFMGEQYSSIACGLIDVLRNTVQEWQEIKSQKEAMIYLIQLFEHNIQFLK